jgi:tetratricopeptide (TPR) repeat protein
MDEGRCPEAETLLMRTLAIRTRVFGAKRPLVAEAMSSLSLAYVYEGRHKRAEKLANQALPIEQEGLRADDPGIGSTYNRIALAYKGENRLAEAASLFQKALAIRVKNYGPQSINLAVILDNLARVDWKMGKIDLAWKLHGRAEETRRKHHRAQLPGWRSNRAMNAHQV